MGKNSNPADAFRKAQRKKELKKNKAVRSQARDFSLVKKDTWDLQDEIERLEAAGKPEAEEKQRLLELKAELEKINKKKAEYVAEHPEHRRLVYRPRKETDTEKLEQELVSVKPKRNLFKANGLPRHPERSVYYDPVMNPFGVAPPGMPYAERDLLPGEIDSDAEPDEDDDDIVMPEGPPPNGEDVVDSDEDIPMPDEPRPGHEDAPEIPLYLQSNSPPPPPPPPFPPYGHMPPNVYSMPPFPPGGIPPPQPFPGQFPVGGMAPHFIPPPPPNPPSHVMAQAPPGFFPRGARASGSMQDPLSSIPHQTFQGHRSQAPPPPPSGPSASAHPSLPAKPPKPQFNPSSSQAIAATVSAAPQLRDLKKEATSFVPTALKRKKAAPGVVNSSRINAAPGLDATSNEDDGVVHVAPRPDLMSALAGQLGTGPSTVPSAPFSAKPKTDGASKSKDDYAKFVEEMGDILGK